MTNWFRMPGHRTDSFIHWNEKHPEEEARKLREAWDKIEDKDALEVLLEAAYEAGKIDEFESNNPEI